MEVCVSDIVIVCKSKYNSNSLVGNIGIVTEVYDDKSMVLFKFGVRGIGSLSHTMYTDELCIIGNMWENRRVYDK